MALSGLEPKQQAGGQKSASGSQEMWVSKAVSSALFSETIKQKMMTALDQNINQNLYKTSNMGESSSPSLQKASQAFNNAYHMLYPPKEQSLQPETVVDSRQAEPPSEHSAVGSFPDGVELKSELEQAEAYDLPYDEPPLTGELAESAKRLQLQMDEVSKQYGVQDGDEGGRLLDAPEDASSEGFQSGINANPSICGTNERQIGSQKENQAQKKNRTVSGGTMADLSGYKDLSKAPLSLGADDDLTSPSLERAPTGFAERPEREVPQFDRFTMHASPVAAQGFADLDQDIDTEFSGNVKTLIRLVNELPQDVTKQTGAQIIRLTMEAMGISMEDVLSEAQSAQSEMLDAVRANIKKIEEYKTVIRKLETDIKYFQGKANELSEIIDLFILSNTASSSSSMESSGY
ncbi:MAG: hypothetical protein VKJ04_02880 [Vampirovibrionales bacterium]|nr:hypothetical protein [Vampirovibrionales bacterium]